MRLLVAFCARPRLRRRVAERLVDRGILGEESKELLGVTVSRRYPEKDGAPEQALRARLLSALTDAGEPPARDAQLIGLLRPFDLIAKNVPREQRKGAKRPSQGDRRGRAGRQRRG